MAQPVKALSMKSWSTKFNFRNLGERIDSLRHAHPTPYTPPSPSPPVWWEGCKRIQLGDIPPLSWEYLKISLTYPCRGCLVQRGIDWKVQHSLFPFSRRILSKPEENFTPGLFHLVHYLSFVMIKSGYWFMALARAVFPVSRTQLCLSGLSRGSTFLSRSLFAALVLWRGLRKAVDF